MYSAECKLSITREGKVIISLGWHPGVSDWFPTGLSVNACTARHSLGDPSDRHTDTEKRAREGIILIPALQMRGGAPQQIEQLVQQLREAHWNWCLLLDGKSTSKLKMILLFKIIHHFSGFFPNLSKIIGKSTPEGPHFTRCNVFREQKMFHYSHISFLYYLPSHSKPFPDFSLHK